MKLKNKLIPILTIAGVASAAAPIVALSSCSKQKIYTYDLLKDGFTYEGGKSLLKNAETRASATTDYLGKAKTAPEMFVNDYVNYLYLSKSTELLAEIVKDFTVSITEPTFGSTTVWYPQEGSETYPTISFTIKYTYEDEVELEQVTQNYKVNGEMTYENVPFFAMPENNDAKNADPVWYVSIRQVMEDYGYIFQYMTDEFAVRGNVTEVTTTEYTEFEGKKDIKTNNVNINLTSYKDIKGSIDNVAPYLMNFESTYLEGIKQQPEIEMKEGDFKTTIKAGAGTSFSVVLTGFHLTAAMPAGTTFDYSIAEACTLKFSKGADSLKGSTLTIAKNAKLSLNGTTITIPATITLPASKTLTANETFEYISPLNLSIISSEAGAKAIKIATNNTTLKGTVEA